MRCLALVLALAAPAQAETLRIGGTNDYPPYLFRDGGRVVGMDADLMSAICARGGFECIWVELPLEDLLAAVRDGRVDVAVSGIGINTEREALMDFTCPYFLSDTFTGSFLARDPGVDLAAVAIAVGTQSLYEKAMVQAGYRTLPFPNETQALQAVVDGRAAAFFGSNQVSNDLAAQLVIVGEHPIRTLGPALGVGEDADVLRRRLDAILAALSREGQLAAMQRAWLDTDQGDVIARCSAEIPQA
jgi:ABC-type amino acid transport substrate-binding protein